MVLQSNPLNMRTEGAVKSVRIKRVLFRKSKRHLLLVQNTNELKEDIGISKINICNPHKVVISRTKSTKTLKNRYYLIKSVLSIIPVMPDSVKLTFAIQLIRCTVALENRNSVN